MNKLVPILIAIAVLVAIVRNVGIFPILALLIIGLSVRKQFKKAAEAEKAGEEAPPWKKKLNDALGQIRKEMDARSSQSGQGGAFDWERLVSGEAVETEPVEVALEPEEPVRPDSAVREAAPAPSPSEKPATPMAVSRPAADVAETPRTGAPPAASHGAATHASRLEELRKAVVWSEILAKPVALRGRRTM